MLLTIKSYNSHTALSNLKPRYRDAHYKPYCSNCEFILREKSRELPKNECSLICCFILSCCWLKALWTLFSCVKVQTEYMNIHYIIDLCSKIYSSPFTHIFWDRLIVCKLNYIYSWYYITYLEYCRQIKSSRRSIFQGYDLHIQTIFEILWS